MDLGPTLYRRPTQNLAHTNYKNLSYISSSDSSANYGHSLGYMALRHPSEIEKLAGRVGRDLR